MMKIGVVCEGPTDFYAITNFFGTALREAGVECNIRSLQPDMDNTRPKGGWNSVINWLIKNPPDSRAINIFGSGLFSTSSASYDALIIQMDTDILEDPLFRRYISKKLEYDVQSQTDANARAQELRSVLQIAGRFERMTHQEIKRHVIAPAVESTENWCVAAFTRPIQNFELLAGQDLVDAFMCALLRFEGQRPEPPYGQIDKTMTRRERFCTAHSSLHSRVATGCEQFRIARDELLSLAQ